MTTATNDAAASPEASIQRPHDVLLDWLARSPVPDRALANKAVKHRCEPVVLAILAIDPTVFGRPDTLIERCLWSAPVTAQLFRLGWMLPPASLHAAFARRITEVHPDTLPFLVEHGLDLNAPLASVWDPIPPVIHAAAYTDAARLAALLSAGAEVAVRNAGGRSLFHAAVDQWHKQSVASLDEDTSLIDFQKILGVALNHGADLDMVDVEGQSALHLAAKRGYPNKCAILIDLGADVRLKDNKGRTPAALAQHANRPGPQLLFQAIAARQSMQGVMGRLTPPAP